MTACIRHISFYLVLTFGVPSFCYADITKLPADARSTLQDTARFHEIHSISDLPPAIVALCAGDKDKIADPGQSWNPTDTIADPSLPSKRLIWAALRGDYYVVHYERGGIAHTFHILIAKLTKNETKPIAVWSALGGPFKDYAGFLDGLRDGKLDDRLR